MTTVLQQLNTEMGDLVEKVKHSMEQVRTSGGGACAGTIWHSDGLILTNAHVARRGPLQAVLPDGSKLLVHDTSLDLAALAVGSSGLPAISLGESRHLQPGQWVLAIGHPRGIIGAVTAGVVIGVGSEWPEPLFSGGEWIAVSLHLRPGYSGGPLVDIHGRLVGINTMMAGPEVGMAVPVHVVKTFLQNALESNRKSQENHLNPTRLPVNV